jgi:hypothetical protein
MTEFFEVVAFKGAATLHLWGMTSRGTIHTTRRGVSIEGRRTSSHWRWRTTRGRDGTTGGAHTMRWHGSPIHGGRRRTTIGVTVMRHRSGSHSRSGLWGGRSWGLSLSILIDGVEIVEQRIKSLDAGDLKSDFLSQLDGRTQICFHFHRSSSGEVLIHDTVGLGRYNHLFHGMFAKVWFKVAALLGCENNQLIDDAGDEGTDSSLFEELNM